jgi:hypothetical protein
MNKDRERPRNGLKFSRQTGPFFTGNVVRLVGQFIQAKYVTRAGSYSLIQPGEDGSRQRVGPTHSC